jgi:hypothetical protein
MTERNMNVVGALYVRSTPWRLHLNFPKKPDIVSSSEEHAQTVFNATMRMFEDQEKALKEENKNGTISAETFGHEIAMIESERNKFLSESQPTRISLPTDSSVFSR